MLYQDIDKELYLVEVFPEKMISRLKDLNVKDSPLLQYYSSRTNKKNRGSEACYYATQNKLVPWPVKKKKAAPAGSMKY